MKALFASGDIDAGTRRVSAREFVCISFVFLLLTVIIFWPAVRNIGHVIVGPVPEGDNMLVVWQLWWFRQAILTGQDPAFTHNVFALYPTAVPFFVENFFTEALALPLQAFASPLATYNILMISSFMLGGVTMYLLAATFTDSPFARMTAAFIFAFTTYHFLRALGHIGEATIESLPFCAWRVLALFRIPTPANAVLAGISIALVPLSEVYYGPYFALPVLFFVIVYFLIRQRVWFTRRNVAYLCAALALAGILTVIPLRSFFHLDPATTATTADIAQTSIIPLSADAAAFVLPFPANIFGRFTGSLYAKMLTPDCCMVEQGVYLGLVALGWVAVALYFAVRGRSREAVAFWGVLGLFGALLALGPQLHVVGRSIVPLPFYNAFFRWPGLAFFRAPDRIVVITLLSVAVLAALGVDNLLRRSSSVPKLQPLLKIGVIALLAVSLSETYVFAMPYPAAPVYIAPVYDAIALDKSDAFLLDLPVYTSGYVQMLQTVHHKRLVGGFTSRVTDKMLASELNVPYVPLFMTDLTSAINLAGARRFMPIARVPFAKELLRRNIHYVVFHRIVDNKSDSWAMAFLRTNLGPPSYEDPDGTLAAWRF